MAHRGAPTGGAAENTIRAFRDAAAAGASGVELDVRGTADGRLAVVHDAQVRLPDGRTAAVGSVALDDLRDRNVEVNDRVPSLEEALRALLGRTGVIVEVKEPGLEERVAAALVSLKADRRLPWLLVASFHPEVLRRFARLAPGIRRALVVAPSGPGLAGRLRALMPLRSWRASGAEDLMPLHAMVTPSLVEGVARTGGRVIPWTVNELADAERVVAAGAAGVITDDLDAVRAAV